MTLLYFLTLFPLVPALGMLFATASVQNSLMSYTGYFGVIAALMLAALVVFMLTVRENEWAAEMQQQSVELGLEDKEEVNYLLSTLSPEQREAIILRFGEQLEFHEIAKVMGCNMRTAQSRVRNGLKIMRKARK